MRFNVTSQHCKTDACSTKGRSLVEYGILASVLAIGALVGLSNIGSSFNSFVAEPGVAIITGSAGAGSLDPNAGLPGRGMPNSQPLTDISLVFGWNMLPETGGGASCYPSCNPQ
jgi:hypothetical protein